MTNKNTIGCLEKIRIFSYLGGDTPAIIHIDVSHSPGCTVQVAYWVIKIWLIPIWLAKGTAFCPTNQSVMPVNTTFVIVHISVALL